MNNKTVFYSSDAVYTARITCLPTLSEENLVRQVIGFEPDEHGVAYRMHKYEEDKEKKNELFLYPNPASNELTVEFSNKDFENINAQLKVYTITGRLIYKTQFNTNNSFKVLSVDMLKNGVYIYRISLSNGIDKSGKLVILKQ
jgi:hypothetical protein